MASLASDGKTRREKLTSAFGRIRAYENSILGPLLDGLKQIESVKVWGIPEVSEHRLPTISITSSKLKPKEISAHLANAGIFTWYGNYYALPVTERLGLEPDGMVRIGLVHYNSMEEVEWLLDSLNCFVATS